MKYVVEDTDTGRKVYAGSREEANRLFKEFCRSENEIHLSQVNDDGSEQWIKIYYGSIKR